MLRPAVFGLLLGAGFITAALLPRSTSGQSPRGPVDVVWVSEFGAGGATSASDVAANSSAIYVTGYSAEALSGQTGAGGHDVFVRKVDARSGEELWTRRSGGPGLDRGWGIAVHENAIYVVGDVDGASAGRDGADRVDGFLTKYDAEGKELWSRRSGLPAYDSFQDVAVDDSGVYVCGYYDNVLPEQGNAAAFVRKYDAAGKEIWTREIPSARAFAVAVHDSVIYVAGQTTGAAPWRPGGGNDAFLRALSTEGRELWTKQFGTPRLDLAVGVAASADGIYVVGDVATAQFPGRMAPPAFDGFIHKYDPAGNELWSRHIRSENSDTEALQNDHALGVATESSGVYVVGRTTGVFAGQSGYGDSDGFVRKYDSAGNVLWTHQFGTASGDVPRDISANPALGLLITGDTSGTFLDSKRSTANNDAFVLRLSEAASAPTRTFR